MKKTQFSMMIAGILILSFMTPLMIGPGTSMPQQEEVSAPIVIPQEDAIIDIYTTPRYPMGIYWEAIGIQPSYIEIEEAGDIITLNIMTNLSIDYAEIFTGYCNHTICYDTPPPWVELSPINMTTYNLFTYQLPGDEGLSANVYEASHGDGYDFYFTLYLENTTTWDWLYYPDFNGDGIDNGDRIYVNPAWPPEQTNATSVASKAILDPGETFWVNGSAHYWPSTSKPGNYSHLIPVEDTPMSLTYNPTINGKTDANGNYSFMITAPTTPGFYNISTDMTNTTQNWAGNETRNVPCVSADVMFQVVAFPQVDDIALTAFPTSVYPGESVLVNGTVKYDDGTPVETTKAWVNLSTGNHAISTDADGNFSQQVTLPMTPGACTITVTAIDETYDDSELSNTIDVDVQTPVLDVTANADPTIAFPSTQIWVNGTATYGNGDPSVGEMVNVSIDGTALSNDTVVTDTNGDFNVLITVPATEDTYTVNVTVDGTLFGVVTGYKNFSIQVNSVPIADLNIDDTDLEFNDTVGTYLEGNIIEMMINVSNTGNAPATDILLNFTSFTTNETYLGSDNITTLNDGEYTIVTFNWTATPGNHTINVTLDPLDAIDEAFEDNNMASKVLFIDNDTDGDGIGDDVDTDDDGDGWLDTVEIQEGTDPLDDTSMPSDIDDDGIPDSLDDDIDGDGYNNTVDIFPENAGEWNDTDSDNIGDNADTDDDGDGVPDLTDAFPLDATESIDTDGDGTGDNADTDDDDDGTDDVDDAFPKDASETMDYDGDGIGDNADLDDDEDGIPDTIDTMPYDTDNDGLDNDIDGDDDNDKIPDTTDTMPYDTDNDGLTNAEDDDDDGDGVLDINDDFPLDETEDTDSDGDGIGDNTDTIDDNADDGNVTDDDAGTDDDSDSMIVFAILGIVLIVVAVVAIMMMGKGPGKAPSDIEPEAPNEETPAEEPSTETEISDETAKKTE